MCSDEGRPHRLPGVRSRQGDAFLSKMTSGDPDRRLTLARVRVELERLIERRLTRPLNEDEVQQWEELTALEEELLDRAQHQGECGSDRPG